MVERDCDQKISWNKYVSIGRTRRSQRLAESYIQRRCGLLCRLVAQIVASVSCLRRIRSISSTRGGKESEYLSLEGSCVERQTDGTSTSPLKAGSHRRAIENHSLHEYLFLQTPRLFTPKQAQTRIRTRCSFSHGIEEVQFSPNQPGLMSICSRWEKRKNGEELEQLRSHLKLMIG